MADPLAKDHVNIIGCKITVRIAQAIKNRELDDNDLPEICHFVLVAVDSITSSSEMRQFLDTLSKRWPIFSQLSSELMPTLPE
jgi:hypothetical protein